LPRVAIAQGGKEATGNGGLFRVCGLKHQNAKGADDRVGLFHSGLRIWATMK
jgi:hypothetical protein